MPAALGINLLSGFKLSRDDLFVTVLVIPRLLTAFRLLHHTEPQPLTHQAQHLQTLLKRAIANL